MSEFKKIKILNLLGQSNDSFDAFFTEARFKMLRRVALDNLETIDYIFVSSLTQAKEASKDFLVEKNSIKIVCFGEIRDMKEFLLCNGRFVFTEDMLGNDLGLSLIHI